MIICGRNHREHITASQEILQVNTRLTTCELYIWKQILQKVSRKCQNVVTSLEDYTATHHSSHQIFIETFALCITQSDPLYSCLDSSSMMKGSLRCSSSGVPGTRSFLTLLRLTRNPSSSHRLFSTSVDTTPPVKLTL